MSDNGYKDEALCNKDQNCAEQTIWKQPTQEERERSSLVIHEIMFYIRDRVAEEPSVRCLQVLWGEYFKILRDKIDKEVVFWDERKYLEFLQLAFRVSTAQW